MANMHTIILFAVVFACWSANIECMKIDSRDKILPEIVVRDEENVVRDEEMNDPVQERLEGELRENQVQDFLQRDEGIKEDEEMNDRDQERLESEQDEEFKEDEEMNDPGQERSESEVRENELQAFLQRDEIVVNDEEMSDPGQGCWTRRTRAAVHSAKLIKIYRSKTLEQCRRLCSENAACKQIEFYHHYGKKILSVWKPNDCWLRGTGTPRRSSLNNDVYVLAPACRKSCWTRRTRAAVHSAKLVKVFHSKTLDQCKHLCSRYSKCKQIEYYQNYGNAVESYWKPNDCWLRSTGVPRRSYLNNDVYVFKC